MSAYVLDNVTNLMNLYISFSSQKTSDVMKILTIFSVFFMPLTFIAGIYGMNFDFMPELRQKWGYPGVMILMLIVVAIIYSCSKGKGLWVLTVNHSACSFFKPIINLFKTITANHFKSCFCSTSYIKQVTDQ